MGIVEDYEHALAEPVRDVGRGWMVAWSIIGGLVIVCVGAALLFH